MNKDGKNLNERAPETCKLLIENKKEYVLLTDAIKSIFNSMHDGIYVTDNKGFTLFVNQAYERISALKSKQLIGHHMSDLISKGYFNESASLKVLKEKKSVSIIDKLKSGKRCLATSNPVCDRDGNILLVITNIRYMTELQDLETELEFNRESNKKYYSDLNQLRVQNINPEHIIAPSKKMKRIYEIIDSIAEVDTTVLILGETGVGKEVIAKEIHNHSLRKNGPFIKVNCASIPDSLFESELFGYEKGAFTGAMCNGKPGLFELADKGTILLDEIGEISLMCQTKLLRVIQEKQSLRLGGTKARELDIRIIVATNQDLKSLVEQGKFREDLYYRLNILPILVPPLRERNEDIICLAFHFLEQFNLKYNKNKTINYRAYESLKSYYWPGNIRQLKNLIERSVLVCPNEVIDETFIDNVLGNNNLKNIYRLDDSITLGEAVEELEKQLIFRALKKHGSTRKASIALGVSQPTVVRKVNKYKIKVQ